MNSKLIKDFLANGGKIQKIPSVKPESDKVSVKTTVNKPITIHTLVEGELLFAEKRTRKTEKKKYTDEEFSKLLEGCKTPKKS